MNKPLLKKTIDLLKLIRSDSHGFGDDGVIRQLDEILRDLETECATGKCDISADKILSLLGKIIENLPFFAQLIELLISKMHGK